MKNQTMTYYKTFVRRFSAISLLCSVVLLFIGIYGSNLIGIIGSIGIGILSFISLTEANPKCNG